MQCQFQAAAQRRTVDQREGGHFAAVQTARTDPAHRRVPEFAERVDGGPDSLRIGEGGPEGQVGADAEDERLTGDGDGRHSRGVRLDLVHGGEQVA